MFLSLIRFISHVLSIYLLDVKDLNQARGLRYQDKP